MRKKKDKERVFIEKSKSILKLFCIISGIILTLIYLIKGGFYSLVFDLRESKTLIIYCISIIVLLCLLVILNISDIPIEENSKNVVKSSYTTFGIIVLIIIFSLLFVFALIDFFLPLIVLVVFLSLTYYLIGNLIELLVSKFGIK